MKIECEELQEEIKESLIHGLLEWVCDISSRRHIVVVPGLHKLVNRELPEIIKVKRMTTEYEIYTDFPVKHLGLTPNVPIPSDISSLLYFKWNEGDYYDIKGSGSTAVWLLKKPKKSKK